MILYYVTTVVVTYTLKMGSSAYGSLTVDSSLRCLHTAIAYLAAIIDLSHFAVKGRCELA
jgi:hypothetical protein